MRFRVSDTVGAALMLDDAGACREMGLDVEHRRRGFVVNLPDKEAAKRLLDDLEFRGTGYFDNGAGEKRACAAAAKRLRAAL